MAVGSSTPSPLSLGDRRFVVVNREEEEEVKKKMISLWKKQGRKQGRATRRGSILTKRGTFRRLCPHPLLHYCQYVPLDCASGSVSSAKPRVPFHLHAKEKGRGNDVGPTSQRQHPNCGAFSISIYYFIATKLRRHLQPSTLELVASLAPSTSILIANFIPLQLQSSLPTSSLVAANFNSRLHSNSKPRRRSISSILLNGCCGVLDAAAAR
jgi:hypothetical protein